MGRSIATGVILAGLALGLSACGYSRGDRALSGGMIGAGGGAAVSALAGANPLVGAAIGGAGGALIGAATNPHDVNLGRPAWR